MPAQLKVSAFFISRILNYYLLAFAIIAIIIAITTITINIPTPIPALNIPPTILHELNNTVTRVMANMFNRFFMIDMF